MLSENSFGLFLHNHQEIFTEHLTYDHPAFALHPSFMQTILNFIWKIFPACSQKVETALTLWGLSENVLQTLCVSWSETEFFYCILF